MPGVKYLHQQSAGNTKPQYIMGHSLQAISLLVHSGAAQVAAVPLHFAHSRRPGVLQQGCRNTFGQGLLQHLSINHTAQVWHCFRSWLRTMNPAMPPSELIVASALRSTLPAFFSVPAFAPGLKKIMIKYRKHDPPTDIDQLAA